MKSKFYPHLLVLGSMFLGNIAFAEPFPATTNTTPATTTTENKTVFLCATDVEPPTTFAYTPGQIDLQPRMSWYAEYLPPGVSAAELCEKMATKLQSLQDSGKNYFLAVEKLDESWQVCVVNNQGDKCGTTESEVLFNLNGNYKSYGCLMQNIQPAQCPWTRGGVISLPGGRYKPNWWPF
jgi:hypothetical protein